MTKQNKDWEKRYNEQFNQANAFLVFKFLPHETYSNAVWLVRDFIAKEIAQAKQERGRMKLRRTELDVLYYLLERHVSEGNYFGRKDQHYKMCKELLYKLAKYEITNLGKRGTK